MKWVQLAGTGQQPAARSSHSITAVGDCLYLFGGEHDPRVPVDNDLYVYDLARSAWSKCQAEGNPPCPRLGHTTVAVQEHLYVFGGRTQVGMDEGALNDLYKFDVSTHSWERVLPAHGDPPSPRSYHTMVAVGAQLFVFGGCSDLGRLSDLHSFDTLTHTWQQLSTNSGMVGRGGASLCASADGKTLSVVGGFCGHELGDFHHFDLTTSSWRCPSCCSAPSQLPARSVFGTSVHTCSTCDHGNHMLAFGGEIGPSLHGHEDAGEFTSETFCYDASHGWHKLQVGGQVPCPRGWFASTTTQDGCMVVHGGLNNHNERLDDMYMLQLHASI